MDSSFVSASVNEWLRVFFRWTLIVLLSASVVGGICWLNWRAGNEMQKRYPMGSLVVLDGDTNTVYRIVDHGKITGQLRIMPVMSPFYKEVFTNQVTVLK